MILRPDGMSARQTTLPLSARQVAWLLDPEELLQHLGELKTVKLAAYCQHCFEKGLPDDVTAHFNPDARTWQVHCACADYPVIRDRGRGGLVIEKAGLDGLPVQTMRLHSVDELLMRLGWSLRCAGDCARLGLADGVAGDNDPTAQTVHVRCGCADRVYAARGTA